MAQKTYSIANFSQTSSWTTYYNGSFIAYYKNPSTDSDIKTIVLSDIPAGSVINSAYIEATFGSPNTGIAMAHTSFSLNGGAYTTSSAWDDTVNPRTEPIPVAYLAPGGTTSIRFSFRANGSLSDGIGTFSGALAYANITVYVDYTEPYSKCTPPTAVSVTPSSTGKSKPALLSWSGAGSGTNNLITGYDVYASTTSPTSGFSLLDSVTASPLTVTSSATNGGKIYYKIVAKGEAGATYYSDMSSAYATLTSTWTNATAPSSVTGPTNVVPGSTQTISWSGASAGTNNAIVKYQLYRDGAFLLETTGLSASVTAHTTSGSSYVYTVKTVAEENSVLSTASHTMKSYVGVVTAPTSISLDANNLAPGGQTTLRWSGQAGGINNEIEDFDVETSNDNTNWTKLATTANSAYSPVTSSATNNATIYYRVKVNGERSSAYSNSVGLVTKVTKPTAPTSISLNDSNLPVGWSVAKTLSWSGAAPGTNNAIYGYRIMVSVNGGALTQYGADIVTANTSGSVSVTSLSSNGTQKFYVYTIGATSVTAEKLSILSTANDTLTTTVTNPTAPTASIPTNVAPGSTQSLSWSGAQNGTNNAIVTYKIYEKIDAGSWAYKASDATSPYTVTASSTNGGKKSYYIVASGASGDSVASNTVVMETTVSKPNAPTSVSLSATSNLAPDADVTLSWSGASNATYNNPISGYRLMRSVDGGAYAQLGSDLPSSTSSQVVKTKNGNGTHAFRVIALGTNLGVHSDMSTPVATATTVVSTPAPPSIVEVPGGGGVAPNAVKTLQWSGAAAGTYNNPIKGYQVYRSTDGTNYTTFGSPILTANTSYSMNVEAPSADEASYYYKVVTLGNTLSINSAMSSAYGVLTTAKVPSTGTLNKSSVTATGSESVMVAIAPQMTTYTHKVTWYINGSYTSGERSKAAGVTSDTYTIPQSWILATTKATTSVTAKCKVETFDGATSLGVNEYTFTVNVPTKSTFALSGVPLTADGTASATATITSKYSGYKHTILWSTTGYSQTHNVAAGTSTQAYAIPKAWCNAAPNATSFTVTVKVTTIKATADGDLSLGDETTTFTANVPTDIVPTITSFTATGVNQNWGLYVRTKSSVQWAPVAAGAYSSTIVSYKIENAYLNSGVLAYSAGTSWTSGLLNYSGSQVFTLTVTDSRGRTASTTGSITVTNYSPPSIASAMFVRSNSSGTVNRAAGTYVNLAAAFSYSNIGSNTITAKAYYREVGTTTWLPAGGAAVTITGTAPNKLGSVTYGSGGIAIAKLYDVKVALTDAYSTVEATNIIPTVSRVFDFRETKAAVGGIAAIDHSFQVPVGWKMHIGGNEVLHEGNWSTYAAAASHGNHVPTPQTANNAVFLRNDNSWQYVTPAGIGAVSRTTLSGQLQLTSYRRSVIALCELSNTNPSFNSWSSGTLVFHRANSISGEARISIAMAKKYNTTTPNVHMLTMAYTVGVVPCTFTYNGVKYGGVEVYLGAAEFGYVEFLGTGNFSIFGLDYYNTQTSTEINSEVNGSLNTTEPIYVGDLYFQNNIVLHAGNYNSYAPTKTGTGASGTWGISVTGSSASCTGNAATATKLATTRALTIGSTAKNFDGSAAVSWSLAEIGAAAASHGNHVPTTQSANNAIFLRNDNSWQTVTPANIGAPTTTGTGASGSWGIAITGNAATATKLATTRALTIGSTAKNFDGSAAVSWSLAEIGAAAAVHSHSYLPLAGGTLTGKVTVPTATRSAGIYGVYDSYLIGHIWSMGSSYSIPDTGTGFGTLYGMAYKHTNNTTGGTMAGGHQIVFCENGTPGAAIGLGGNIWTSGTVTAGAFSGPLTGNAATATKLATTRALTIGSTAKNFDGSAAVSWSLAEIGALGASAKAANSSLLNGVADSESNTASTIAKRNSSGDIVARLFRSEYANQTTISGAMAFRINNSTDNYIRFCSDVAAIRTFLSAQKTITRGTSAPSGGSDGDIYIQYVA